MLTCTCVCCGIVRKGAVALNETHNLLRTVLCEQSSANSRLRTVVCEQSSANSPLRTVLYGSPLKTALWEQLSVTFEQSPRTPLDLYDDPLYLKDNPLGVGRCHLRAALQEHPF
jgi:hypothetical protein